jgi:hypothetical protein
MIPTQYVMPLNPWSYRLAEYSEALFELLTKLV